MTKLQQSLVSRATAAVVGAALLYAGWRCACLGDRIDGQMERQFNVPMLLGIVLLLVGGCVALYALLPFSIMSRVFHPPTLRMGENDEKPSDRPNFREPFW